MTTTRTPHVSQRDADTPENRRLQPGSADAPFFDKSGIARSLIWPTCLNLSMSGLIRLAIESEEPIRDHFSSTIFATKHAG